jgi:hypothetical protein
MAVAVLLGHSNDYTVFLAIAVHMVFLTGFSRYQLASFRSYFRSMCLTAMTQLALSLFFLSVVGVYAAF